MRRATCALALTTMIGSTGCDTWPSTPDAGAAVAPGPDGPAVVAAPDIEQDDPSTLPSSPRAPQEGPFGGFFDGGLLFPPDGGSFAAPPTPTPARLPNAPLQARRPPPPITGGGLAVSDDGAYVVVADLDRDLVQVLSGTERALRGTVQLDEGAEPSRLAFDAHGQVHVVLRRGGVARIDLASATLSGTAEPCVHPRGIAHDPKGDRLWVSCLGGALVGLDAADHREVARQQLADDLRDVIVRDDALYVSRYRTAELLKLTPEGAVAGHAQPEPAFGLSSPILVPRMFTLPNERGLLLNQVRPPPGDPDALPTAPAGPGAEPTTFEDFWLSGLPTQAWRLVDTPRGLAMLHQRAQEQPVRPDEGGYGGGFCSGPTSPTVTLFGEQGPGVPAGLDGVPLAVDLAVSPSARWMAVAAPGAWLRGNPTLRVFPVEDVGQDAGTIPVAPERDEPLSPCVFPRDGAGQHEQVVAVAFSPTGELYAYSREPSLVRVFQIHEDDPTIPPLDVVARIELPAESVRDTAHDLFHADVGAGLACATCHGEATDDAHVWEFEGIGPRRTQNMRGGLLGTEPFHWEGDMEDFGALVHDVMTGRMGGFEVPADMAQALAEWIDVQPALTLESEDAEAEARGEALFASEEVGCADCHAGPQLTNNQSYDVGTGELLQVPSLMGLGWRAPFLHDGCAATLRERFDPDCGGGDAHGHTSQLDEDQLSDLTAYLRTL